MYHFVSLDDGHDAIEGNCSSLLGLCLGFAELGRSHSFAENFPEPSNAVAEAMSGCQDWGREGRPSS